jgi:hypothetical protein
MWTDRSNVFQFQKLSSRWLQLKFERVKLYHPTSSSSICFSAACAPAIVARAAAFSGESPVNSWGESFNVKEVHDKAADSNSVPDGSADWSLTTLRVFGDAGIVRPAQRVRYVGDL